MTRKDYNIIAEALAYYNAAHIAKRGEEEARRLLDETLAEDNANYKPALFWKAVEAKTVEFAKVYEAFAEARN